MTENRTVADDQFIDSDSLDERYKDIRALQKEVAELLYTKRSLLFFEKPGLTSIFYSSIFRHEKKLKLLSAKIEKYKFEIKQIQAILNGQDKSLKDVVKQSKRHFAAVKNELKEWKKHLKKTIKTGGDFTFKISKKKEKQLKNIYDWIKAEPVVTGFKEGYSRILLAPSSNYYYSKNLQGLKEIAQYAYECNLNWYKPINSTAEMRQVTSACQAARDKLRLQIDQIKRQFPFTREDEIRYDDEKERCIKELSEKILKAHKDVLEWRQKRNEFTALYRLSKRKPLPKIFKKRAEITPRRTVNASVHLMKTNVAGTAHVPDVASLANQLKPGDRLFLIREPNNEYDSNAIMVLNQKEQKLGYIPKAKNPLLAKMMDEGLLLYADVDAVEQNDSWVKIAINVFLNY
ncbi:MAG: HIRAN domain-containing protein [Thermoguttaceae bacterium]|nr:HIRAN domain-containing protein [Thermoguttaceae bacterium]